MKVKTLKIHPDDNILVALTDLEQNEQISNGLGPISLREHVPAKHKFALADLKPGDSIYMYGLLVGKATQPIPKGGLLSTENVKHVTSDFHEKSRTASWTAPDVSKWKGKTFLGYHRADGQVGTANYWLVIPMVFCENRNVTMLKNAFLQELGYSEPEVYKRYVSELVGLYQKGETETIKKQTTPPKPSDLRRKKPIFENVDGIKFLTHEGGCGGIRQDAEALCGLLAGYIHNPNVAGATVLSLGCQNAQVDILRQKIKELDPDFQKPLFVFEQQKSGTEYEMLSKAIRETFLGLVEANKLERKPAPLDKLVIGLECGGSDGFSGISANPAIGHTSDLMAALGGKTILSEFPELCGVEQELINRCVNGNSADRFIALMRSYSNAAVASGSGFDMNPSPGNIKDGLITDAMKSAGAAKKGGTSPVADVLDYPEYVNKAGLNLLCTPGNDVESTTALAGAGANIVLFTTGLGTPTGNPIAPVVKISSNTVLAQRMPDIIDIDSGSIISGDKTIEDVGGEILDYIIDLASGKFKTKAMELDQDDFIPWKRGVSL